MQMTSDGYLEPLPFNPAPFAIGAVITAAGVAVAWSWLVIAGLPLILVGVLWAGNAWGTRRVRVTRSKLLMEEDPLVRGFLIGPRRSRVQWDETESVDVAGDCVKLVARGGRVVELAKGAKPEELSNLLQRIRISMELHSDDQQAAGG
jgi:hypothetical protein